MTANPPMITLITPKKVRTISVPSPTGLTIVEGGGEGLGRALLGPNEPFVVSFSQPRIEQTMLRLFDFVEEAIGRVPYLADAALADVLALAFCGRFNHFVGVLARGYAEQLIMGRRTLAFWNAEPNVVRVEIGRHTFAAQPFGL